MRVLVISVHPDDEALGCSGTILKHRMQGDELSWLIVTEAHSPQWTAEVIDRKAREVEAAAKQYGMKHVRKLGFPTMALDQVPLSDLITGIHSTVVDMRPEVIYTIHAGDVHSDHRAVFQAVTSAIKPFNSRSHGVKRLLSFETLSSTDAAPPGMSRPFLPNVFSDITPYMDEKLRCMEIFGTESQGEFQPRGASAIRALARFRGATIGVEYAEAFMLIRECQ